MEKPDLLQPVTDAVRRQAKAFLRGEGVGALATLEPGSGAPMASRVSVASAPDGSPVFLISRLSAHFGALEADPRASLLLGQPGAGDPLAHPRISVHGRALMLSGAARDQARARFLAYHPKAALYADFADFAFWRLEMAGASLNGGFGKAHALARDDLLTPVVPGLAEMEADAVAHMNEDHADALALYAEHLAGQAAGQAWRLVGFDAEGLDLASGAGRARVWFEPALEAAEGLRPRLVAMAKRARGAQG